VSERFHDIEIGPSGAGTPESPCGTTRISRDAVSRSTTSAGGIPAKISAGSPGTSTRTVTVGGPATELAW
jgi:hypothetical protein